MCIYTSEKRKIAEEDIVVYKVLIEKIDNKSGYQYLSSPIFNYQFTILNGQEKNCIFNNQSSEDVVTDGFITMVGRGFFHSYCDVNNAFMDWDYNIKKYGYGVYKCIIPKGSEYFYSEFSKSYASKKIIVTKEKIHK